MKSLNSHKHSGFTLIELMLAMSFVSILLVAIAMMVIQIGNIYNRGLTLKEVDQAGLSIASELQRGIASAVPFQIITCTASPSADCNYINDPAWGGRLCMGQYSYIWNYGNILKTFNPAIINKYSSGTDKIRFVKIIDPNSYYCTLPTLKNVNKADAAELLEVGQHDLAIHSLTISNLVFDSKTGQRLYNISFTLGTNEFIDGVSTIDYLGTDPSCKLRGVEGADPTYCSVDKFSITARSGSVSK